MSDYLLESVESWHESSLLPEDDEPKHVLKNGYLFKRQRGRGQKNLKGQKFQQRYVKLSSTYLQYFADKKATKPKGYFAIKDVQVVETVPEETFNKPFCFQIGNRDEYMYFCALNEEERQEWMKSLRIAAFTVQRNKPLTTYHVGALGLHKQLTWSCCGHTGRRAEGCEIVTTRQRITSLPLGPRPISDKMALFASPSMSGPTRLTAHLSDDPERSLPIIEELSPVAKSGTLSGLELQGSVFLIKRKLSDSDIIRNEDILKRYFDDLGRLLLRADISQIESEAFSRHLVPLQVHLLMDSCPDIEEKLKYLLDCISSRVAMDASALAVFLDILENDPVCRHIVGEMRDEMEDDHIFSYSLNNSDATLVRDPGESVTMETPDRPSKPVAVPNLQNVSKTDDPLHSSETPTSDLSPSSYTSPGSYIVGEGNERRQDFTGTRKYNTVQHRKRAPKLKKKSPSRFSFSFPAPSVLGSSDELDTSSVDGFLSEANLEVTSKQPSLIDSTQLDMPSVPILQQRYQITDKHLAKKTTDSHLLQLSQSGNFRWQEWVELLGLTPLQIADLEKDERADSPEKGQKSLGRWRDRNGFKATYRRLLNTFLSGGSVTLAEELCELLRGDNSETDSQKSIQSPMTAQANVVPTDCPDCTSLQVTFLTQLRTYLIMFKSLNWSKEATSSAMEQAIREYVGKFIRAGCTSIDHLHKHLQDLHDTEKLIDDSAVLEKSKQLATEAFSLHAATLVPLVVPITSTDIKKKVVLSDLDLYHASVCSLAVNKCSADSHQEFFKKQPNHSLRQVSISRSRSGQGRYLVAVGDDSTHYIAFQSEPDVTLWPRSFKSFEEGISSQTKMFPIHFISELLNKKKRVVLTGFSLGGLLACSVTTQVWKSRYFTPEHLQENLSCITFAQPHYQVAELTELARECPKITTTIHAVYNEQDHVPQLMKFLDLPCGFLIKKGLTQRRPPPPFVDPLTLRLVDEIGRFINNALMSPSKSWSLKPSYELKQVLGILSASHAVKQPVMTYHVISTSPKRVDLVFRNMTPEEIVKQSSTPARRGFSLKLNEHLMDTYVQKIMQACCNNGPASVPSLTPTVKMVELHDYGSEFALVVEGTNLSFCDRLRICGDEIQAPLQCQSGNSVLVNVPPVDSSLLFLEDGQMVEVEICSPFVKCLETGVPVCTKEFPMSVRQEQLSRLTPSQVIEVSYLSALLEQQPYPSAQPLSDKVMIVRKFLEKIVQVVPIESIGYAVANGNEYVASQCEEAITATSLKLSSMIMADAQKASTRQSTFYLSPPKENGSVICDLNLESLYPITSSIQSLKSPVDTLRIGRDRLNSLNSTREGVNSLTRDSHSPQSINSISLSPDLSSDPDSLESCPIDPPEVSSVFFIPPTAKTKTRRPSLSNSLMLHMVNRIRQTELSVCISLIEGFMKQKEIEIPLLVADHVIRESTSISVSALSSLSLELDGVRQFLGEYRDKQVLVRVEDYAKGTQCLDSTHLNDGDYAGKLYFIVQALNSTVTCNTQCVSYSLERQLVNLCAERNVTEIITLDKLVQDWDLGFSTDIISLVARSHRPLIARWLKWALMVHNLREELAKYTAVGVVGLVNSGKSRLVKSLFGIEVASGTTEVNRTTVPFIYNLKEKVEGLDVVDFPGVDDRDESISDLADLLLTLAQIIIFVVDYRKVHTDSGKKWLERLQVEKVPVLVCLTYADKLYAEHMTEGRYPEETYMKDVLQHELSITRNTLKLPEGQKITFCSFQQDRDSVLNCDEGRQRLRGVGIDSPKEVGDWLVDTFKNRFGQEGLAEKLNHFIYSSCCL